MNNSMKDPVRFKQLNKEDLEKKKKQKKGGQIFVDVSKLTL